MDKTGRKDTEDIVVVEAEEVQVEVEGVQAELEVVEAEEVEG